MTAVPVDMLGLAARTLTTIAFVPQIVRIVRGRHADDLSWWTFGTFALGVALWLVRGLELQAVPIIVANVVTLGLALVILVLKGWYRSGGGHDAQAPARDRAH